ncbi:HAMP domain-containing histidine kinase [Paeniglutamicibacter sp. ABSL32-1]|uniref:sensor histidine kinase n=1 Tax=Paeniglutamicibacter quisquiliarum TaxID=2849498 RepID=UPI001C2D94F4|nr:HAMP domain-containing sensor histidine kinase [Paeniglutamicibacter quisquiliarum]MBV1779297.1 HAMP domain-containing histidine kinase [Paeniglutamicibacter quisquiliarum]
MTENLERQGSAVSARWRIVGWIVLTTALALLAVTVTMRSVMSGQVAEAANVGVVQEIEEFRTFAAEGLDPRTARPFTSMEALMERYLARQQPLAGEAIVGVAGGRVLAAQGLADGSGDILAGDAALVDRILRDARTAGVYESAHGTVRWGKAEAVAAGEPATIAPERRAHLLVAQFTGAAQEEANRQAVLLFGVAVGGLALTAGIAWLVARQIMRPIRTVRETAESITAHDLSARIPVQGRDDLARLAETLNAMLDRIEGSHLAQRHFIAEAREHLNEPQRLLAAALRDLVDGDMPGADRARIACGAQQLIARMGQTLADLDVLAQSGNPGFVKPARVPVSEVTADVAAEASTPGAHPGRHFRIEETGRAEAWLDAARIADAVRQLVDNAVAHTSPGDTIGIGSSVADGAASFWVANPGPPLDPERARALLESYRSTEGTDPGMGLGLAVVKAVAEAHRGIAWVESGDGAQTRFGLTVPLDALVPARGADDAFADRIATTLGEES